MHSALFCSYYQATVERQMTWFVVATLKSYEHTQFDRTIDVASSVFEFFVPAAQEELFLAIMARLEERGYVSNLKKLENRFQSQINSVAQPPRSDE
jgi:hypothetical protein